MRALLIHPGFDFAVSDLYTGWCEGLTALGVDVLEYNMNRRLDFYTCAHVKKGRKWVQAFTLDEANQLAAKAISAVAFEFWPDVVIIISAFFVSPRIMEVLRARGMKVVIVHTESPYENDRQAKLAQYADLNLLNDPTGIEAFGDNAYYQPHCYRPAVHFPRSPDPNMASDFCFVGTGFPSRVEFFEKVDWSGIDVALAGNWKALSDDSALRPFVGHDIDDCFDNSDAAAAYCSAKMGANLYRVEAQRPELSEGWALGPREVEMAACGLPFLRQRRGEGDELLSFLPTFDTPTDFGDQLRYWLARPRVRAAAASKARAAIADRTFDQAARRLLARLS